MKRHPPFHVLVNPEGLSRLLFLGLFFSLVLLLDGYVLVVVSRILGIYLLLAAVATTGLIGLIAILGSHRAQVRAVRRVIADGNYPSREFRRILALVVGAICLMIPGFATDVMGILIIFPPGRWIVGVILERTFSQQLSELYEYLRLEE